MFFFCETYNLCNDIIYIGFNCRHLHSPHYIIERFTRFIVFSSSGRFGLTWSASFSTVSHQITSSDGVHKTKPFPLFSDNAGNPDCSTVSCPEIKFECPWDSTYVSSSDPGSSNRWTLLPYLLAERESSLFPISWNVFVWALMGGKI
jgi:hypothetical protein